MDLNSIIDISGCVNDIDEFYRIIGESKNLDDLKKLYSKVKEISPMFYVNDVINPYYNMVLRIIRKCELLFDRKYLFDICFSLKDISINSSSNEYEILEYIINETRKYLLKYRKINYENYDKFEIDFTNYCEIASINVKKLCDKLGIDCYILEIYPGFDGFGLLFDGSGFHFFNIIKLGDKFFLIDITFGQFFKIKDCNIERLGLMNYFTPKVGCFISDFDMVNTLIQNGYIELDNHIFKTYMDGFAVSFRNGLYYEETDDYSYTTNYSVYDYINFLTKQDSQIKHEGKEVLGYQKKPIRNW